MGEKVFLLASPLHFSMPPASLSGWSKSLSRTSVQETTTQPALALGFMLGKPAWDRKNRPICSNYKTSLLPDKPAAGV
jgi:hypothetical protein